MYQPRNKNIAPTPLEVEILNDAFSVISTLQPRKEAFIPSPEGTSLTQWCRSIPHEG